MGIQKKLLETRKTQNFEEFRNISKKVTRQVFDSSLMKMTFQRHLLPSIRKKLNLSKNSCPRNESR